MIFFCSNSSVEDCFLHLEGPVPKEGSRKGFCLNWLKTNDFAVRTCPCFQMFFWGSHLTILSYHQELEPPPLILIVNTSFHNILLPLFLLLIKRLGWVIEWGQEIFLFKWCQSLNLERKLASSEIPFLPMLFKLDCNSLCIYVFSSFYVKDWKKIISLVWAKEYYEWPTTNQRWFQPT